MTAPQEQLQVLISEIDGVLQKTTSRLPWVLSGDASQQRKILERVRNHLVALHKQIGAETRDRPGITPGDLMTYDIYYQPAAGPPTAGQPVLGQPQLPPSLPAALASQQMVQLLRQEMVQWQTTLVQPLQAELATLRQQRETLQAEVRQLERQLEIQRQNALLQQQASFQHTLLHQQASLQPTLHDFLQAWMGRLQESLSQQISQQINQSFQGQAPLALSAGTSPDPLQLSNLQLSNLEASLRLVFESLQRDVKAYQDSLAQGLNRLYGLGQQSEGIVSALLGQMAQQIESTAAIENQSAVQSSIIPKAAIPDPAIPGPAIPRAPLGGTWPPIAAPLPEPAHKDIEKSVDESVDESSDQSSGPSAQTTPPSPSSQPNSSQPNSSPQPEPVPASPPQYAAFPYPGSEVPSMATPRAATEPIDAAIDDWIRDTGADQATQAALPPEFTDLNLAELSLSQLEAQEIDHLLASEISPPVAPLDTPIPSIAASSATVMSLPSESTAELDDFYHSLFGSAGTEPPTVPTSDSLITAPNLPTSELPTSAKRDHITSLTDLFADVPPLSTGNNDDSGIALADHPALSFDADGSPPVDREPTHQPEEFFIPASPEETLLPSTTPEPGSDLDLELDEITFSSLSEDLFNLERESGSAQPFPEPFLHSGGRVHSGERASSPQANSPASDLPELEDWGNLELDDFTEVIAANLEEQRSPSRFSPALDDLDSLFTEVRPSSPPPQSTLLAVNAAAPDAAAPEEVLTGFAQGAAATESNPVQANPLETSFTFADIAALFADAPPVSPPSASPLPATDDLLANDLIANNLIAHDLTSVNVTPASSTPATPTPASVAPANFTVERLNDLFVEVPTLDTSVPHEAALTPNSPAQDIPVQDVPAQGISNFQNVPMNFTLDQIGNLYLEVPTTAPPQTGTPDARLIKGDGIDNSDDPAS